MAKLENKTISIYDYELGTERIVTEKEAIEEMREELLDIKAMFCVGDDWIGTAALNAIDGGLEICEKLLELYD